ncbi:unnamed protein product [Rhizophagus irregularis]|nr:unnamed protein product [Rhizophagus irregularis]
MHANNQTNNNNNNSTSAIDLTYIYTLSIVKIKSIGNQTNSPKIRKDSSNHLQKSAAASTTSATSTTATCSSVTSSYSSSISSNE